MGIDIRKTDVEGQGVEKDQKIGTQRDQNRWNKIEISLNFSWPFHGLAWINNLWESAICEKKFPIFKLQYSLTLLLINACITYMYTGINVFPSIHRMPVSANHTERILNLYIKPEWYSDTSLHKTSTCRCKAECSTQFRIMKFIPESGSYLSSSEAVLQLFLWIQSVAQA